MFRWVSEQENRFSFIHGDGQRDGEGRGGSGGWKRPSREETGERADLSKDALVVPLVLEALLFIHMLSSKQYE